MLNISRNKIKFTEEEQQQLYVFRLLTTPRHNLIIAYILLFLLFIVVVSMFLPWQQNIKAKGTITAFSPSERPQKVYPIVPGRITEWYITEGKFVKEGDPIAKLAEIKDYYFDPKIGERMQEQVKANENAIEALENKASALDEQSSALYEGMKLSLEQAKNKVQQLGYKLSADSAKFEAVKVKKETAQKQYEREQELFEAGLTSRTSMENKGLKLREAEAKYNEAENKLATRTNELLNAQLDVTVKQTKYLDKIAKSSSDKNATIAYINDNKKKLAKLQTQVANLKTRQDNYIIRAPQTGYIVKTYKNGIGEMVKAGDVIASIVPENPNLAAEIYISAYNMPLIDTGVHVRLQFEGWPAFVVSGMPRFSTGTYSGVIKVIDRVNTYGNKYRVLVTPIPQLNPKTGEMEMWPNIQIGSGVYAWAMLQEVPVWYEIWRQLNAFPPLFDKKKMEKLAKEQGKQKKK